ncbi:phosphoribosylformylglycinamidine synthase subunit PurQ [Shigella flexneri]
MRDAAHLAQLESKGRWRCALLITSKVTETYPANPNGLANGITAVTSESGRVNDHDAAPGACLRTVSNSWHRKPARTAHGCAFSAMRVNSWVKFQSRNDLKARLKA